MSTRIKMRLAILGTVGVPANYGGFETLAENLVEYHHKTSAPEALSVYCSAKAYAEQPAQFLGADLRYLPLEANGLQSIPYDMWSMLSALRKGCDTILLLGVSGALLLPVIRLLWRGRIVTNIDGIEWRRDKWGAAQRRFLRLSEAMAVRWSHQVIADNAAIADYVRESYGKDCAVIAYGGDHATLPEAQPLTEIDLPAQYAFKVCRIEPENNVHMVLDAFANQTELPLVLVGNWTRSDYGLSLREKYANTPGIHMLDPIYDIGKLKTLRAGATAYIHGHSAGGTNPSLVEAMHFSVPVAAFDCSFNRYTTEDKAEYFKSADDLRALLPSLAHNMANDAGRQMLEIAQRRYTWDGVGDAYFSQLRNSVTHI